MYVVVVSLVALGLLVAVLLFDSRVRVEVTKSAETSHFSARLLQQACATLRRCAPLSSIRRSGAVEPSRRQRGIAHRVLHIGMPLPVLHHAHILAPVGHIEAAGVPEHVRMDRR